MLRNVLADYLDNVTERELDMPLLLLLPSIGFYDVHWTHGAVEFGKDFIAKKRDGATEIQYSFQSKAGDINQAGWRSIQGQILEAVTSTLSHPNFDAALPHQVVLITTGDLRGNAGLGLQDLNERLLKKLGQRPVACWSREDLIEKFIDFGLSGIHRTTATGFAEHALFFFAYSRSLQGILSQREIEAYSRQWLDPSLALSRRLLRGTIEASVLAQQCVMHGRLYEAAVLHLALLRMLCAASYTEEVDRLGHPYVRTTDRLHDLCTSYIAAIRHAWESRQRNLLKTDLGSLDLATYLVQCARIMEMASLAYFTTTDSGCRDDVASFLEDFITGEPGSCHPLSDRYAVSLVLAGLVLCDSGRHEVTGDMIRQATIWLCDRYQEGMGLAGLEADEAAETRTLLGYAFDFIDVPRLSTSFLATALGDLGAFLGARELYGDIINDIKACDIVPQYWQAQDSVGACNVEGEDVVHFPSDAFDDNLSDFTTYRHAIHLASENTSFRFAETFGPTAAAPLMAFLRDRYFPKLWPLLSPNHAVSAQTTA